MAGEPETTTSVRLFVALELPDQVRAEIETVQHRLRRARSYPVKWVAAMACHLTLQFLGEVEETLVPSLLEALEPLAHLPRPRLCLDRAGAFPNLKRPQTLWVGVGGGMAELHTLQQAVAAALHPFGFVAEDRPFRAHLTLGRVRRDATPSQRTALGTAIAALDPPQPCSWESGPPLLFQSTLTPTGAIYQKRGPA